jgi:hypothetical protein
METNIMKIITTTFLLLITINANSAGLFEKPLAICTSIQSLGAYKLTSSVVNKCEKHGVSINFKKANKSFGAMITEEQFSTSECNTKCALLNALDNTEMSSCVEKNFVDSFVNGFMGRLTFNSSSCKNIKTKLGA